MAPSPVTLTYTSAHGEEGYPANSMYSLTYRADRSGRAVVEIDGPDRSADHRQPDQPQLLQSRWRSCGHGHSRSPADGRGRSFSGDRSRRNSAAGPPRAVAGTPFDFREARRSAPASARTISNCGNGRGYDHNSVSTTATALAACGPARGAALGAHLELLTDQPGLHVYSGNYLDGTISGKGGGCIRQSDAMCLEPQCGPIHRTGRIFQSPRLDPGGVYRHRTVYRFCREGAHDGRGADLRSLRRTLSSRRRADL